VLGRVLEGLPEQEPWVGGGAGRVQVYPDVRNHILLKWALSQVQAAVGGVPRAASAPSPTPPPSPGCQHGKRGRAPAAAGAGVRPPADWARALQRQGAPSHPGWGGAAWPQGRERYAGDAAAVAATRWREYRLPAALTLADVTATLPVRWHRDRGRRVRASSKRTGKINVGARCACSAALLPPRS